MPDIPSLQYIREALDYDPESGVLSWRTDRPGSHFKTTTIRNRWLGRRGGKAITCVAKNGYIVFNLNKIGMLAHRICFALHHGLELSDLPEQIDHRDTCRTNNRASNLRPANSALNSQNMSRSKSSVSGFKGVTWGKQRQKWRATIQIQGKQKHLGFFESAEDAHSAYVVAANENFGEFARAA